MAEPKSKSKTKRPKPPDDLKDEGYLEWHRIVDELDAAGKLDVADRAMITLYARTHGLYVESLRAVEQHGIAITYGSNPGLSPYYKASEKLATQLRGLLNDMGLTPASRKAASAEEPDDLDI